MFPKTDSVPRCPPSLGRVRVKPRSPPSSVLRRHYDFLDRIRARLWIHSPAPMSIRRFAPLRRRTPPQGLAPLKPGATGCSFIGRYSGAPRFLCRPFHAFAPLSDPGQSGCAHLHAQPVPPPPNRKRRHLALDISGLNHAASASAAYASTRTVTHPRARLASGWWLAFAGRESNPLDCSERFPLLLFLLPPFPGLSWRNYSGLIPASAIIFPYSS